MYFVLWFSLALRLTLAAIENAGNDDDDQNGRRRNDGDRGEDEIVNNCAANGFRVNDDAIIRTQDSRKLGARYLNETELPSKDECLRWCCQVIGCNVAVFEEKDKGSCYLFDCGPPSDFRCKFTSHHRYVSAIMDTIKPTPITAKTATDGQRPSSSSSSVSESTGRHASEWIPGDEHANDLKSLRHQRLPPANTKEEKEEEPAGISTSPLPVTQSQLEQQMLQDKSVTIVPQPITTIKVEPATVNVTSNAKTPSDSHATPSCSHYQFQCRSSGECIAIYNACDGIPQCRDASDESPELGCPPDAWRRFEGPEVASSITSSTKPPKIQESPHQRLQQESIENFESASSAVPSTLGTGSPFHRKDQSHHHRVNTNFGQRTEPPSSMEHSDRHGAEERSRNNRPGLAFKVHSTSTPPSIFEGYDVEQPIKNDEIKSQPVEDTSVVSQKLHVSHSYLNPYQGQKANHAVQQESQLVDQGPKYYREEHGRRQGSDADDREKLSSEFELPKEHQQEHENHPGMNHGNRHYYEDEPSNYDTEHAVDDVGGHYGHHPPLGGTNEREYYEGGYVAPDNSEYPASYHQESDVGRRPATVDEKSAKGSPVVWPRKEYDEDRGGGSVESSGGHRRLPVVFQSHRGENSPSNLSPPPPPPPAPQSKIKPDVYEGEEPRFPKNNPWPEIPYETEAEAEAEADHRVEQHSPIKTGHRVRPSELLSRATSRRPSAAVTVAVDHVNRTSSSSSSPPLVASRHVHDGSSQIKLSVATDAEKEERASEASGAVLALTLGLSITGLLLVLVGCRLRMVRRRLRRSGRSPYAHDADYLVNGMYL